MRQLKLIIAALFSISPFVANADLIDQGDTTVDTATGLEWLDVTLTQGESYNSVVGEGFGGYIADGYRYATTDEVCGLFGALGDVLDCVDSARDDIMQSSANLLLSLLGDTSANTTAIEITGLVDGGFTDSAFIGLACVTVSSPSTACVRAPGVLIATRAFDLNQRFGDVGSFLVRAAVTNDVPEPGTLALLGLGLVGMAARRKKKV